MASYSQTCKTLFEGEKIGEELFTEALDHSIDEAKDDNITELTDHMDRQQLEIGFEHMVQRLKNSEHINATVLCKSSSSDSQLLRSSHEKRPKTLLLSNMEGKRHTSKVPIRTSGRTSPPGSKKTPKSTYNLPKLTLQENKPNVCAYKYSIQYRRFCSLPMDLSNSTATFQCLMGMVLRGLTWESVLVYIDDIVVYAQT